MAQGIIARRRSAHRRLLRAVLTQREITKEVLEVAHSDPRFIRCPSCGGPVAEVDPDWMGRQRVACDAFKPCFKATYVVEHLEQEEREAAHRMAVRSAGRHAWGVAS